LKPKPLVQGDESVTGKFSLLPCGFFSAEAAGLAARKGVFRDLSLGEEAGIGALSRMPMRTGGELVRLAGVELPESISNQQSTIGSKLSVFSYQFSVAALTDY
jgi:hypothetical protein